MKHGKSVFLFLAGVTTMTILIGPVRTAEALNPQKLTAA